MHPTAARRLLNAQHQAVALPGLFFHGHQRQERKKQRQENSGFMPGVVQRNHVQRLGYQTYQQDAQGVPPGLRV